LLFAPAAVIGNPAGPPSGLDVNVVNEDPIPVTGDVNATVTGDVNVANTPDVNVVNTNPVPVTVQNEGELVFIREGYTVPDGKTLKIVDISVRCFIKRPDEQPVLTEQNSLNIMTSVWVQANYPDDKCPEPLQCGPTDCNCVPHIHAIGTAAAYRTVGIEDGVYTYAVFAGRQTNIVVTEGGLLLGVCSAIPASFGYSITTGVGYLY